MKFIDKFSDYISKVLSINNTFIKLLIYSIVLYLIVKLINKVANVICFKVLKNNKTRFIFIKKFSLVSHILLFISFLVIWEEFIIPFITLISFVSAAVAYSLRDTIINFFCGIYIRIAKPFIIEDRIMIDGHIGDVINITNLSFEILEVNSSRDNLQSTGAIIHVPNSMIFSGTLKNYVKVFKYVWNEIEIKIPFGSDVKKTKGHIYKIIKNNEVLKKIPNKMMNQLNNNVTYRIYFNKLEPIIYTNVNEKYISLIARYLVHPKKNRNIQSDIWNEILRLYKNNEIELYHEK